MVAQLAESLLNVSDRRLESSQLPRQKVIGISAMNNWEYCSIKKLILRSGQPQICFCQR